LTIPGATAERNVISGNSGSGIELTGAGTSQNTVAGNYIGTDALGSAALGNGQAGVEIDQGASSNLVGGLGLGNTIAHNAGAGVVVLGSASTGNQIRANSIYANSALGIDLGGDGVTPNDPGDTDTGPNNLQNYPVIDVARHGSNTRVLGHF